MELLTAHQQELAEKFQIKVKPDRKNPSIVRFYYRPNQKIHGIITLSEAKFPLSNRKFQAGVYWCLHKAQVEGWK